MTNLQQLESLYNKFEDEREYLYSELVDTNMSHFHSESIHTLEKLKKEGAINVDMFTHKHWLDHYAFEISTSEVENLKQLALLMGSKSRKKFSEKYSVYEDKNYILVLDNQLFLKQTEENVK